MRDLVNNQLLPAELQHFWHEGQVVEFTILVQSGEDFGRTSDFNQFANAESRYFAPCHSLRLPQFHWSSQLNRGEVHL
jgi:hypothetical protein